MKHKEGKKEEEFCVAGFNQISFFFVYNLTCDHSLSVQISI